MHGVWELTADVDMTEVIDHLCVCRIQGGNLLHQLQVVLNEGCNACLQHIGGRAAGFLLDFRPHKRGHAVGLESHIRPQEPLLKQAL